jgi:hypothetical protein
MEEETKPARKVTRRSRRIADRSEREREREGERERRVRSDDEELLASVGSLSSVRHKEGGNGN